MKSQRQNKYNGTASEHLVCADLWIQGYKAYMVHGDIFDVVLKAENQLYKIQVKSSTNPKYNTNSLTFNLSRGCKSKDLYRKRDIDVWAFVDLMYKKVCYIDVQELNNKWKITIPRKKFKQLSLKVLLENKIGKK
tara:strand:+ start:374 stop:778 length:405 start_codon:yes stop_codon:yes gene_type:complete